MKKLICAKDIEELHKQGQLVCQAGSDTIITPSARDAARTWGITITQGQAACGGAAALGLVQQEGSGAAAQGQPVGSAANAGPVPSAGESGIDSGLIYSVLQKLLEQGKLDSFLGSLSGKPYYQERDSGGLKVVAGSSVKMDVFDTGTPGTNVHFQELVSKEESKMSAGFLEIDRSRFAWELTYEEIDYVIDGTLIVEINGKPFTAHKGDVVFVPAGSKVFWQSPDKAKVFYSTYPANWADLI